MKVKQSEPNALHSTHADARCTLHMGCDAACEAHIWKRGQRSQNVTSVSDTCFHGLTLSCSSVLSICGATDYGA